MPKRRIHIRRRSRKIGFMGRGMSVPTREKSEITRGLAARIDEGLLRLGDAERDRCREDARIRPGILRSVFSKRPEVVVRPDTAQCVAEILDVCLEEKTPAVPRGLGTAGLGGAMAVRGGVVIDLSHLCRIVEIDRAGRKVTVEAGCTWDALEQEVREQGLCLNSYPSSGAHSTIGGWISTGGYGIGTLAGGNVHDRIAAMEVAVPSGILVGASQGKGVGAGNGGPSGAAPDDDRGAGRDGPGSGRYSIRSFTGTEGQLGVVTSVTLPLKAMPEKRIGLLLFPAREEDIPGVLGAISRLEPAPHAAMAVNAEGARVMGQAWGHRVRDGSFVLAACEGTSDAMAGFESAVRQLASAKGVQVETLDAPTCGNVWKTRFSYMGRHGERSLVLGGEVLVGLDRLGRLLGLLRGALAGRQDLMYEAMLVGTEKAMVTVRYLEDVAGGTELVRDVRLTAQVTALASGAGAVPYGIGMWNTHNAGRVLGGYLKTLKIIKRETDRLALLNPGKFFRMTTNLGMPVPGWLHRIGIRLARGT